jgi:hypothetical protein
VLQKEDGFRVTHLFKVLGYADIKGVMEVVTDNRVLDER